MTANLPEEITLDLDAYEKPVEDQIPPFRVKVGGRVITMTNPDEIDWVDLIYIESPTEFIKFCVSEEDRDHLLSQRMPGHKFGKLMKDYQKHFKIDQRIEDARRQQRLAGQPGGF